MGLNFSVVLTAGAALVVSSLAQAVTKTNSTLDAKSLAQVDGVLSYCTKIDSRSSSNYLKGESIITNGHSNAEVSGLRHSTEYAKSLAAINLELGKVGVNAGLGACRAFKVQGVVDFSVKAPKHSSSDDRR
jgi:hypothetical protein